MLASVKPKLREKARLKKRPPDPQKPSSGALSPNAYGHGESYWEHAAFSEKASLLCLNRKAMQRTYEGILSQDRVEWTGKAPDPKHPVRVQVTILGDAPQARERGRKMAEALKKLAEIDAFSALGDPVAWQREVRRERPLPGRET